MSAAQALGSDGGAWSAPMLMVLEDDLLERAARKMRLLLQSANPSSADRTPVSNDRRENEAAESMTIYDWGWYTPSEGGSGWYSWSEWANWQGGGPSHRGGGTGNEGGETGGTSGGGPATPPAGPTDAEYWFDAWSELDCDALGVLMDAVHSNYESIWLTLQTDANAGSPKAKALLSMLRGNSHPYTDGLTAYWERARIVNRQYMVLLKLCCFNDCDCCGEINDYIPLDEELLV